MHHELELEEKLRKSEVLTEDDIYKDFMMYARQVKDQLDIYTYMEENEIGINVTQYWLARFVAMRRHCQLVSLVKLIDKVKYSPDIEEWRITQYQRKLSSDLKQVVIGHFYSGNKNKRKVSSFNLLKMKDIYPETRLIGNIEVYIDSPQRDTYALEAHAKYIEAEMKDYCQLERGDYLRMQAGKPLSFLAKKQQHLLKLAEQLLSKNNRKSFNDRKSVGPARFSNNTNLKTIENLNQDDYHTPKINQGNQISQFDKSKLKNKIDSDRSRDSVEILKEIMEKKDEEFISPKFKFENQQFQKKNENQITSPYKQERCRAPETDDSVFGFSFGKQHQSSQTNFLDRSKREVVELGNHSIDNAFIVYSFSKDVRQLDISRSCAALNSEDFQLDLLIAQCQKEKYQRLESRTYSSEIDSNQENRDFQDKLVLPVLNNRTRKPFEVLLQTDSHHIREMSSIQLEELVQIDDQKNPEIFQFEQKEILQHSQQKRNYTQTPVFFSERKRLSSIYEERTNSRFKNQRF